MQTLKDGRPVDYAGNGVYVVVDTFGVWLRANHHECPTDEIFVEEDTVAAIIRIQKAGKAYLKAQQEN